MAVMFIFVGPMAILVPKYDITDPLFTLVISPGFYLHHIEVADKDLDYKLLVAVYLQKLNLSYYIKYFSS